METNIVFLVLIGLLGWLLRAVTGKNPIAAAKLATSYITFLFLVLVPLMYFFTGVDVSDAEAIRSWTDNYVVSIASFIHNQSPSWVAGYMASGIVGAVVGSIKGFSKS